jgi:hypothetical protein
MNILKFSILLFFMSIITIGCNNSNDIITRNEPIAMSVKDTHQWTVKLSELSDKNYKHNPDISIRHKDSKNITYSNLELDRNSDKTFNFSFIPENSVDTITLESIELMEWLPTICEKAKQNDYLSKIAIVNQEWNRHQVKFTEGKFSISGNNLHKVKRVDLARNCLNAYLWEIITYAEEDGILKPYYHGWFDFPHDLYGELFEERNTVAYNTYQAPLEQWADPENNIIDLSKLRTIASEFNADFQNLNDTEYPLIGEREKKYINIVYPKNTTTMEDFLTDSTLFATFSPPGFYNPKDPRQTKLSLLKNPNSINYRTLTNGLFEIEVDFLNTDSSKTTKLFISGLDKNDIPTLAAEDVNKGWKNSMGFGNHTFYETYAHCLANSSLNSEYFSMLTDEDNKWLDSHFVGIDGPLLHWDENEEGLLHLWVLAFERHAFVGHYTIKVG